MTTAINYVMSNYSDARFRGVAIDNAAIDVLVGAIRDGHPCIEGIVGGISVEYVDDAGTRRSMPCESYRMRLTRIGRAIEVGLTCIPLAAEGAARYAVGVFEYPMDWEDRVTCSPFDERVEAWKRDVVRPRVAAMVTAVWGDWAEAAHDAGRRFCTPKTAGVWVRNAITSSSLWADYWGSREG